MFSPSSDINPCYFFVFLIGIICSPICSIFQFPIMHKVCPPQAKFCINYCCQILLGKCGASKRHFTTIVYSKFGGQTECIMGNWETENCPGSFAAHFGDYFLVRNHLRSNMGIIRGPIRGSLAVHYGDHLWFEIIRCPIWRSFAVQYGDHLCSGNPGSFAVPFWDHFRSGIICGPIWGLFVVQYGDHLWSRIIRDPIWGSFVVQYGDYLWFNMGIICGPGSFAIQYGDHLHSTKM